MSPPAINSTTTAKHHQLRQCWFTLCVATGTKGRTQVHLHGSKGGWHAGRSLTGV